MKGGPREQQSREMREAAYARRRKNSGGIAEGREGQDGKAAARVGLRRSEPEVGSIAQTERGPTQGLRARVKIPLEPVGIKAGPPEDPDGVSLTSMAHPPGLIDQMAEAIKGGKLSLKRGRPKKGEVRDKPWEADGISKAQWYRRQKESKT
jgi:hypothetical protein